MHRPHRLLALLVPALLGWAYGLDAAGLAPALEGAFPPSVSYLDCPFAGSARTCVLVPGASDAATAVRRVLGFLRERQGAASGVRDGGAFAFRNRDTAYRLRVAPSRARPGMFAATLSFAPYGQPARGALCLQPRALFDLARLPTLTPGQYAAMASAVTCRGPDPTDARGRTPLWDAVESGNLAATRTLLRAGADPNHISDGGWTPLLAAGRNGTRAILHALLRAGADPSYIAPDGATLASLEPFNRHLAHGVATPAGPPILPEEADPAARGPAAGALALAAEPAGNAPAARGAARAAAGSGGPRRERLPWLPLAALFLVGAVAAVTARPHEGSRTRRTPLTDTAVEWQALARPTPLARRRRRHDLEPAHPWNDTLA